MLSLFSILISNVSIANAKTNNAEEQLLSDDSIAKVSSFIGGDAFDNSGLEKMGRISFKEKLTIGGKDYNLYPTFDSKKKALKAASNNPLLRRIKDLSKMDTINDNWKDYQEEMYRLLDDPNQELYISENDPNYIELIQFFDIYENDNDNREIKRTISNKKSFRDLYSDDGVMSLLPYDIAEEIRVEANDCVLKHFKTAAKGFDKSKGD